ncbi:nitrate reductase associated protein [Oxalobacteraceae bacterium R-40]|uniref:Nitrate reductase associated protein n=1 Tax=Keguizhuia sedimenti TaxID=3064264 RepID=A0ABU1BJF0_9BURK|nr:nitrate reductase associated protein [Oxalobacteraceae bacterium R-40]
MNEMLQFEIEKCRGLRRFPMYFRLKLDVCGIKLSKRDWISFDLAEKERLISMPCETPEQIMAFREKLKSMIRACGGNSFEFPAIGVLHHGQGPWADKAKVPDTVRQQVNALLNGALNLDRWANLSDLQRFALIKLTTPGKIKPDLRIVLEEFSLLDDGKELHE